MKFYTSFLFFAFLHFGTLAQGRSDDDVMGRFDDNKREIKKSALSIKTDVLTPLVNPLIYNRPAACLSLEYVFGRRQAFQLTGQYGTFAAHNQPFFLQLVPYGSYYYFLTDIFQSRAELILDYKYYLKDSNDFKGLYCGLYVRGIDYTNKFYTTKGTPSIIHFTYSYIGFCAGVTAGYQIILKNHFVFDFLLGLGARNASYNPSPYDKVHTFSDSDVPEALRTPLQLDLRTTLNIGYKF